MDREPSLRVEARRLLRAPARAGDPHPGVGPGTWRRRRAPGRRCPRRRAGPRRRPRSVAWLDRLGTKDLPPEIELDLIEAARRRKDPEIARQLRRIDEARSHDDPLSPYRETLVGGDAERGWKVFSEKAEVECIRCHKARDRGGEVGPALNGIGSRQDRRYLLESIVAPDRQIAKGFDTLVVATADGQVHTGIVKEDTPDHIRLITPEGKPSRCPRPTSKTGRGARRPCRRT